MPLAAETEFEVRCPLHGSIPFDARERDIINHPLVQRLRSISQLGLAHLVFPGATHTRFSHALGVMHVTGRIFDQVVRALERDSGVVLPPEERRRARQIARLAGLLHDLGHPPFSHTYEPLLPQKRFLPSPRHWYTRFDLDERASHEDFSVAAIYALSQEAPHLLPADEAQDVCALIDQAIRPSPELTRAGPRGTHNLYPLLKQMISGEIDADRMDYLRRDAHFAGVAYGNFDLERLIQSLSSHETPRGRMMALDQSAIYAYENFLMARFHMAMQVYFHKTLLAFEYCLTQAVREGEITLKLDGSLEGFMAAREDVVLAKLYAARDRPWSARIVYRRPLRRVLELHEPDAGGQRQRVLEALAEAKLPVVHVREQRALSALAQDPESFPVYVQETLLGKVRARPLHEASVLLGRYNQIFRIEYVYCDAGDYERAVQVLEPIIGDGRADP
jgi:HD superfamily phosphohydrolase